MHDAVEELCQDSRNRTLAAFAELLGSWEVEEKVSFDECSAGLVVEDELLVAMGKDIFGIELVVEFRGNLVADFLVRCLEEVVLLVWELEV